MLKDINKIIICIIIAVFFLSLFIPKIELAEDNSSSNNKLNIGDVDNSGTIDMQDVLAMLKHIANEKKQKHPDWKLNDSQFKRADIVEDNKIDVVNDVIALLKYIAAKKSQRIASKHPEWLSFIDQKNNVIVPTDITLDKATLKLMVGQKDKLTATIVPENAEDKRVEWKSSDEKIAQVDEYGNIKAVAEGQCTINATTWNGHKKSCAVTITKYIADNGNTANNTNSTSNPNNPNPGTGGGGGGYSDPGSSDPGPGTSSGPGQGNSEDGEEVELTGFEPTANPDTIFTYQSGKINIEYSPENTTEKGMTYSVDTQGKDFTLNEDGSYKAGKDTGTFEINVESTDHPGMKKPENVTVKPCRMTKIEIASVDEDKTKTWIWNNATHDKDGITRSIDAAIHAEEGGIYDYITDKDVEWMTSNSQLCTIVEGSVVTSAYHTIGRSTAKVNIKQPGIHMVFVSAKNTGLNSGAYDSCKIRVEGIKQTKEILLGCGDNINLRDYFKFLDKNGSTEKAKFILLNNPSDILNLSEDGHLEWPKDKYLALDTYCDMKIQIEGHSKEFRVHVQS